MKGFKYVSLVFAVVLLIGIHVSSVFADDSGGLTIQETPSAGVVEIIPQSTETTLLRVSASDTSGLHSVVLSLIGDYNPIATTTEYRYPSGTGYQTRYQVDVTPDWSWIMTCALFIVVIWSVFRFIGGIFTK